MGSAVTKTTGSIREASDKWRTRAKAEVSLVDSCKTSL